MEKSDKNTLLYLPLSTWAYISFCLAMTAAFYLCYYGFTEGRDSAFMWIYYSSSSKTDTAHNWMIPLISLFMLRQATRTIDKKLISSSTHGIWFIILGTLLCVASVRTQQPRLAIGALPFILSGLVWYYWGTKIALKTAFPFFFLWMALPLPGFQHATVGLQQLSAQMAHWGAQLCGVQTILEGTTVTSADGSWDSFNIAGGCSGIRSLMALLMISVAWGYLAHKLALWKRLLLALSAIPLSIIGNAFRVASIFVCAEYINPAFAGKTWHDWSGLLFFFPATLIGLTILHGLLSGEIPFLKKRRVITRRSLNTPTTNEKEEA